ncbi:MAG: carboxymuconolactone decarboxylase family protein [Rhodomicrobium sp.]|nr:carboxymuconolactone decarboxylase family protein [Rhodomicrobium sp.]
MQRIASIEPANAQGQSKELLDAVKSKLGIVPNLTKVMANEPAVLNGYLSFSGALAGGTFDAKTREALALAVAGANSCGYCASAHSAISKNLKVPEDEITRRLTGHASDPKLDAALVFARQVVAKKGLVSDADMSAVRAAGNSDAEIVEIIGNVVLNLLTNYINHVADTAIDFPVVDAAPYRA